QFGIEISINIDDQNNKDKEIKKNQTERYYSVIKRVVSQFIDEMNILLILDGFDEISSPSLKKTISGDIRELSLSLRNSNFILTSRTGEFEFNIEGSRTYEICSLTDKQIKIFIKRWLRNIRKSN